MGKRRGTIRITIRARRARTCTYGQIINNARCSSDCCISDTEFVRYAPSLRKRPVLMFWNESPAGYVVSFLTRLVKDERCFHPPSQRIGRTFHTISSKLGSTLEKTLVPRQ